MGKLTTITTTAGQWNYSRKGLAFLHGLAQGLTVKLAAKVAGLSERHGNRLKALEITKAYLRSIAAERLTLAAPRAAERIVELLTSPSERTCFQAAELVLATQNIKPPAASPTVKVDLGVQVGYVVNWQPDISPVDVTPDDRAAPIQQVRGEA